MSKADFGEHLKREREMRGVSLEEICGATRIGTRFLEALENEEWERLPGGVFNRGFVRAVARYLGLDEEGMVAEYALAMSESQSTAPAWPNPQLPLPLKTENRWLPWVGLAVLVVLAGAGWFAWRRHAMRRSQHAVESGASDAVVLPPGLRSIENEFAALAPGFSPSTGLTADEAAAPAVAGSTLFAGDLELEIEAGKSTTLSVSVDGNLAFQGQIAAGQKRTWNGADHFDVSTGDSGAVLLELNGQTIPPLGPPGEPGKITLTRRDAEAAAGGPD